MVFDTGLLFNGNLNSNVGVIMLSTYFYLPGSNPMQWEKLLQSIIEVQVNKSNPICFVPGELGHT